MGGGGAALFPMGDLWVHVGNEFNACNEWRCSEPGWNMSTTAMAAEVASFYRDVQAAVMQSVDSSPRSVHT